MRAKPRRSVALAELYSRLRAYFGHQNWWPGESQLEIIIGAVLTQNTAWSNVEKAIRRMKEADVLHWCRILELSEASLSRLIQPAGYHNVKARRLMNLVNWLHERCQGDFQRLDRASTGELRSSLLTINGVGPETCDSILLYALERPVFVIDAYTKRAMSRIGIRPDLGGYDDWQHLFMSGLRPEVELYKDYHAQWVALSKSFCRVKPVCGACPMREVCEIGAASLETSN